MKKILTPEQYAKWKEMREKQMDHMKNRGKFGKNEGMKGKGQKPPKEDMK